jgi:hypothetical protein
MPDGSFVAFRIPELCAGYFATGRGADNWTLDRQPFLPLIVWSDRRLRPTINEAYVADVAYGKPSSRLALPSAVAESLTIVPDDVAAATRRQPRDVILDNAHDLHQAENEIGDRRGDPPLEAAFGWATDPASDSEEDSKAYDCVQAFQGGQLIPNRVVLRLTFEQCKQALSTVTPFVWDGKQFQAEPQRMGTLIFQRLTKAMQHPRYMAGGLLLKYPPITDTEHQNTYSMFRSASPARDPNHGF